MVRIQNDDRQVILQNWLWMAMLPNVVRCDVNGNYHFDFELQRQLHELEVVSLDRPLRALRPSSKTYSKFLHEGK